MKFQTLRNISLNENFYKHIKVSRVTVAVYLDPSPSDVKPMITEDGKRSHSIRCMISDKHFMCWDGYVGGHNDILRGLTESFNFHIFGQFKVSAKNHSKVLRIHSATIRPGYGGATQSNLIEMADVLANAGFICSEETLIPTGTVLTF